MSEEALRPEDALRHIVRELRDRAKGFALVGGLAVSVRGEVRTTRDVDLAVAVQDDEELEARYRKWLPVVEIEGERVFTYYVHEEAFRRRLTTAQSGRS